MASASPLVAACITQIQSDALANSDIANSLYIPQMEAIIKSTLTAVAASNLISGADQTIIKAQLALTAADSG